MWAKDLLIEIWPFITHSHCHKHVNNYIPALSRCWKPSGNDKARMLWILFLIIFPNTVTLRFTLWHNIVSDQQRAYGKGFHTCCPPLKASLKAKALLVNWLSLKEPNPDPQSWTQDNFTAQLQLSCRGYTCTKLTLDWKGGGKHRLICIESSLPSWGCVWLWNLLLRKYWGSTYKVLSLTGLGWGLSRQSFQG